MSRKEFMNHLINDETAFKAVVQLSTSPQYNNDVLTVVKIKNDLLKKCFIKMTNKILSEQPNETHFMPFKAWSFLSVNAILREVIDETGSYTIEKLCSNVEKELKEIYG